MKTAAILDFQNHKFLTPRLVHRAQMHYQAKFRQNRSNGWGDMAILLFFKMAAVRHLEFSNSGNFNDQPDAEAPDASPCQFS